eukprot:5363066-Karenia_brevis.AAC.1
MDPAARLVKHKEILREAGAATRKILQKGIQSPDSALLTLVSISRAHWQQDIHTASLLIKRDALGRRFLRIEKHISGCRVLLSEAAAFSEMLAKAKLGHLNRDISYYERNSSKHNFSQSKKNTLQALIRKARLWVPGDARHQLAGVLPEGVGELVREPQAAMQL